MLDMVLESGLCFPESEGAGFRDDRTLSFGSTSCMLLSMLLELLLVVVDKTLMLLLVLIPRVLLYKDFLSTLRWRRLYLFLLFRPLRLFLRVDVFNSVGSVVLLVLDGVEMESLQRSTFEPETRHGIACHVSTVQHRSAHLKWPQRTL